MPVEMPVSPRRARKRRYTFEQRAFLIDRLFDRMKAFDCRYSRLLGNFNSDFGLTRARLRILDCVIRFPGWNMSRIAYQLDLSRQTVQRTIQAMSRAGLLDLEPSGKRALIPKLTGTGRVVSKLRLTQAHEWSHQLTWGVPTAAASAAGWLFHELLWNLPEKMATATVDPDNLPTGMSAGVRWAVEKQRIPGSPLPRHPIIADGDRLKPARR
jgi:DNA-binding MarR family transcriptional regulator